MHEIIICAAVRFDTHWERGKVVVGNFHGACFAAKAAFFPDAKEVEQGFVTSQLRFVGREEARRIAVEARQVNPERCHSETELFSEDLPPLR
jgi:hypothetical protein